MNQLRSSQPSPTVPRSATRHIQAPRVTKPPTTSEQLVSQISRPPLLSTRTALVLLLGLVCGTGAGTLTYLAGNNIAAAILAGLTASGVSVAFFHAHVGYDPPADDGRSGDA